MISFGLVIPGDVLFLGGLYAFGATIAFTIAHVSLVRLRMTDPDRSRPFKVPLNVRFRGAEIPLPVLAAAGLTVIALAERAGVPRRGQVHRDRLDAVRARGLRRLPARRRADVADASG